ncbi:unnamed protein product [Symbiodinium natans]|uniref:Uncharacterized protein n=1 Tax=Symbiodinium natans TaxID=878477 RepID=A0A812P896_9DINO|nr:unnamed protein product [Symbiodinium natans]
MAAAADAGAAKSAPASRGSGPFNHGPGLKVATSSAPVHAPANYRTLPDAFKNITDDGDLTEGYGSGRPSGLKCEACGFGGSDLEPDKRNRLIYFYDMTQRNGNYSTRSEIECRECGCFSTIETWEEG